MELAGKMRVANTSVSTGLVLGSLAAVYRMGTIAKMLEVYPIIKAFLIPILVFCVTASVVYATFFVPSALHALFPGVRWGRAYADRCVNAAKNLTTTDSNNKRGLRNAMLEVELLELELIKYQIPCPPLLVHNSTSKLLWRDFLIIVGTRAKQYDLRRARQAFKDMNPDARQEWIDLAQSLEEQYS